MSDFDRDTLIGLDVVAIDGELGKVANETKVVDDDYLLVNTGSWIDSATHLLPLALIEAVDQEAGEIRVRISRERLREAPAFNPSDGPGDAIANFFAPFIAQ